MRTDHIELSGGRRLSRAVLFGQDEAGCDRGGAAVQSGHNGDSAVRMESENTHRTAGKVLVKGGARTKSRAHRVHPRRGAQQY